jgi:hypothetical protein
MELLDSTAYSVWELVRAKGAHDRPGVYAISRPDDDTTVYVGRTKTESMSGRMVAHRSGSGDRGSDLRDKLKQNPEMPQRVDDYRVRYVVIEDDRDRLFFESFAIGCLAACLNK